jgi:hypothetical protein
MASESDDHFKAMIVATILNYQPEKAIAILSRYFHVDEPKIGVGVFKGCSKRVRAAYSGKRKEILAAKREYLYDPFTILHEFYHHLRNFDNKHRGTEKYADRFAQDFIEAYNRVLCKFL